MGWNIAIGEAFLDHSEKDHVISVGVHTFCFEGGVLSNSDHGFMPVGYVSFPLAFVDNWIKEAGMDVFAKASDKGIMEQVYQHGVSETVCLRQWHLNQVMEGKAAFIAAHPEAIPKWSTEDINNSYLMLFTWFEYWIRWALDNCRIPAILVN